MPSRKRGGNPEETGIPPCLKKYAYLPKTALCVFGRYPKRADKRGEDLEELKRAGGRLKVKTALGIDGLSNEILKEVIVAYP